MDRQMCPRCKRADETYWRGTQAHPEIGRKMRSYYCRRCERSFVVNEPMKGADDADS